MSSTILAIELAYWQQTGLRALLGIVAVLLPAGEAYVETENPLGVMGYYIVSKGELVPYRVKIRSASFNNVSITPWLLEGVYVPDVISILASLYFILGDIDR